MQGDCKDQHHFTDLILFSSSYCEAVLASPSPETLIPSELVVEYHLALVIYCL